MKGEARDGTGGRVAAIRFTLVAAAVVLALLADHFIRTDDIKWAAAPLVIAIACLALADTRRTQPSESRDDKVERPERATLSFGRFPADPNARFSCRPERENIRSVRHDLRPRPDVRIAPQLRT